MNVMDAGLGISGRIVKLSSIQIPVSGHSYPDTMNVMDAGLGISGRIVKLSSIQIPVSGH